MDKNDLLYRAQCKDDPDRIVEGYPIYDDYAQCYRIVGRIHYSTGTFIDTFEAPRIDINTLTKVEDEDEINQ